MAKDSKIVRFWIKTEKGVVWIRDGIELMHYLKSNGITEYEGGGKALTIAEFKALESPEPPPILAA